METLSVKALKIVSDAKVYLEEAIKNNEETFTYNKVAEQDKTYSENQQKRLALYNIENIAKQLSSLEKRKDRIDFLNKGVEKSDKSLILTELILRGHYTEDSLGNLKPLEIFAFIPQCNSCGDCAPIVYSTSPNKPYYNYRESVICHKCGHDENKTKCECERCSARWDRFAQTLKNFKPYFDEGLSIINLKTSMFTSERDFEINDTEDVDSFLELIAREDYYPSLSFSIRDANGGTIHRLINH